MNFLLSLQPNIALVYGYKTIFAYEASGVYLTWSNIFQSPTQEDGDYSMFYVFFLLIFDICFFVIISIEYSNVITYGKYYYQKFKTRQMNRSSVTTNDGHGIHITDLTYKAGAYNLFQNLSIDIVANRITVLLGDNGTGKSTLMSILSGFIKSVFGVFTFF